MKVKVKKIINQEENYFEALLEDKNGNEFLILGTEVRGFCTEDGLNVSSIDESNLVLSEDEDEYVKMSGKGFSCEINAKILNSNKGLVSVGAIVIGLSLPLPGDLKEGQMVHFYSDRLDV
jgi:hypothetical protein